MRVLFISLAPPWPPDNGLTLRAWAVLRALASRAKVTLLMFVPPGTPSGYSELQEICEAVEAVPLALTSLTSGANYLGRLRSLFSPAPYGMTRFVSPEIRERIAGLLQALHFDAVVCETVYPLDNLPAGDVPLVVDEQNIEHQLIERYAALEKNPAKRWYALIEAKKLKRAEARACAAARMVLCCSEPDRAGLERLCPQAQVRVVPNVVDTDLFTAAPGAVEPRMVLFQGGMDWFPNRDAVEYFVSAILPKLRRRIAGVKFVIAGRSPSPEFRRRFEALPGVEFTGTLPDLRPVIGRAAVCVVPLRVGSGTRLKILEAAAAGKAVVSTSVGAEGLEFENGREIVLEDDPARFANAVAKLLRDSAAAARMGQAAREKVQDRYSQPILETKLWKALAEAGVGSAAQRPTNGLK